MQRSQRSTLARAAAEAEHATVNPVIVRVIADGGILEKNPGGFGYGSFATSENFLTPEPQRRRYGHEWSGHPMTNIVAEILTCIESLEWLCEQGDAQSMDVRLTNDCKWVCSHLASDRGRSKKPHLRALHGKWMLWSRKFANVHINWQPREVAVDALGH